MVDKQEKQAISLRLVIARLARYKVQALVVIVVVGLVIVSWGQVSELLSKKGELEKQRLKLETVNRRLAFVQSRSEVEVELMESLVERVLPVEKPVFATLSSLGGAAREAGVVLTELSTSPGSLATDSGRLSGNVNQVASRQGAGLERMLVKLEVEGGLFALNDFLLRLAKLAPLVEVEEASIALAGSAEEGEVSRFRGELELAVYWSRQEDGAGTSLDGFSQRQEEVLDEIAGFAYYGEVGF